MPYSIGSEIFATKGEITKRCQEIRDKTPDGAIVAGNDFDFLISLFKFHDGWHEKAHPNVDAITTHTPEYGKNKRGFLLIRNGASPRIMDISFAYTIKIIPSGRELVPQALLDFKAAGRTAVQDQIWEFRDWALRTATNCPLNNIPLERGNCEVHYPAPNTFESILCKFTQERNIRPLHTKIASRGTLAIFQDDNLSREWAAYHRQHAKLLLVSEEGRRKSAKSPTDWSSVL
jgi:hypothetical protein